MSLAESPSSGSDDFAALLDAELEHASAADSASLGEEEEDDEIVVEVEALERGTKRRRLEELHEDQEKSVTPGLDTDGSVKDVLVEICPHPGYFGGLCFRCGKPQAEEDVSGVAFGYIHKGLKLGTSEMDRLRGANLKNLLHERKLVLILDLDHTLINSTKLQHINHAENELGIRTIASKDDPNKSIFSLESMYMLTKLRPFVKKFLKEASSMFEMYIYTMGDKAYAIEIAKLLDPDNIYFSSKVISNSDCTQRHQKGLDVVLGAETVAVILDDTEYDVGIDLCSQDVRQVIKAVRKEVLHGCKLVFSRVFPQNSRPQDQFIWKMAEQLGAVCCAVVDSTVTHVVALDPGTEKALWAGSNKKFLVHPQWIEAANFRWCRQPEEEFPVPPLNRKGKEKENAVANHHKETSKGKENAVAGEKETGQDEDNTIAGQEKAQETAPDTIATGPTDS